MCVINLCNNTLAVKFAACTCIHGVNTCFVNKVLTIMFKILLLSISYIPVNSDIFLKHFLSFSKQPPVLLKQRAQKYVN